MIWLALFTLCAAAPIAEGHYHPTKLGTKIVRRYYSESTHFDAMSFVSDVKRNGNALIVTHTSRSRSIFDGIERDSPVAKYSVSVKGIWLIETFDHVNEKWKVHGDEEECILPGGVKERAAWTTVPYDDGVKFKNECRTERITVPAGTFVCLAVSGGAEKDGKMIRTGAVWYAKGIGPIRSKHGDKIVMEAVKVEIGK